jgi:hypothetical protein
MISYSKKEGRKLMTVLKMNLKTSKSKAFAGTCRNVVRLVCDGIKGEAQGSDLKLTWTVHVY